VTLLSAMLWLRRRRGSQSTDRVVERSGRLRGVPFDGLGSRGLGSPNVADFGQMPALQAEEV
jgi:hypothetical protein